MSIAKQRITDAACRTDQREVSLRLSYTLTFSLFLCLPLFSAKVGKTSLIMSLVSEEFPEVVWMKTCNSVVKATVNEGPCGNISVVIASLPERCTCIF